jgi:hypothetical protein
MLTFTKVLPKGWLGNGWLSAILHPTVILLGVLAFSPQALSQEVSIALLQPGEFKPVTSQPVTMAPATALTAVRPATLPETHNHRFWDRENSFLFATSAAFNTADFIVTRDNLRGGGKELNPVTRVFSGSTPALAVNFAGETAGVVALSYFFHKTGHHQLERLVSVVNIGSSAGAVSFDMARR